MDTKPYFGIVLCLWLLALTGYAQQTPLLPNNFLQMRKLPLVQQSMKTEQKVGIRALWNGHGSTVMAVDMLQKNPELRTAWGISDEQFRQIQDVQKNVPQNIEAEAMRNPEFRMIVQEMQAIQNPDDPLMLEASIGTIMKSQDLREKIMSVGVSSMANDLSNLLSPEQKQRMDEFLLTHMSEMPVFSPSTFGSLGLTDAQKQQMERIKNELEPEFEKQLENLANAHLIMTNKVLDELEKQGGNFDMNDPKAMETKVQAIAMKLSTEDPEIRRLQEEVQSRGNEFSTQFRTKMFDVLTDEQWARFQKLTDDPPEYIKALRKKMQEQQKKLGAADKVDIWLPGPNSWKPGDPIPEQYRQERQERTRQRGGFPRGESQ